MSGIDKRAVLRKRAQDISRPRTVKHETGKIIGIMDFILSGEGYAFETLYIREVCKVVEIIKLPGAPSFLKGLVNNRGSIISVVDLKLLFNIPSRGAETAGKLIVLSNDAMEFAVFADSIEGVRSVEESSLVENAPVLASFPSGYVKGITQDRTIILDASVMLNDNALKVCDYVD